MLKKGYTFYLISYFLLFFLNGAGFLTTNFDIPTNYKLLLPVVFAMWGVFLLQRGFDKILGKSMSTKTQNKSESILYRYLPTHPCHTHVN